MLCSWRLMGHLYMRLTTKYPLTIVTMALAAALATGVVAYQISKTEMRSAAERQSIEILESRKAALSRYLRAIQQDLSLMVTNRTVQDALTLFIDAWPMLNGNPEKTLQTLYIHENPHPTDEKEELDQANDGSGYSAIHGRYHPWFRQFKQERGYSDVFLFDTKGNLVYTVIKELDFATNLTNGRWRSTDLGRAFRTTTFNKAPEFQAFFDFKSYEPSHGAPASFISAPVFDDEENFIGVLAFQMPIGRINEIMQVSAGMGKTGRAYLVGQDLLVRNDSRFSTASEILKTKKPADIVNTAMEGVSGVKEIVNDLGNEILVTYTSITFGGQVWAIIAEFDLKEVLAPVSEMRHAMLLAGLLIAVVVTFVGILSAAGLSRPIVSMTGIMQRLAKRDLDVEIPASDRADEIGDMEKALTVFKENAVARQKAEASLGQRTELLKLLNSTTEHANKAGDLNEAIEDCLDAICSFTGWPVGHAYIRGGATGDTLEPTRIWHLDDPNAFAAFRQISERSVFEMGVGLLGHVMETGEPAWLVDVTKDPRFLRAEAAIRAGVKAGFACPVLVGVKVVAVLEFFATEAAEPDHLLLDTLVQVGAQLGRVHERQKAEAVIRRSEEQLRMALDNMPGAMWVVDDDLKLVLVNDQYKDFYGDPGGLVMPGTSMREILRAEAEKGLLGAEDDDIDKIVEDRIASLRADTISTFEDRTPDGRFIKLIRNPANKGFVVSVASDITDLKQAEMALATMNEELQELNELKNKFMGMAAHDLRNPLGAIRGMTQLIMDLDLGEVKEKEFISSINQVTDQMLDLLNDLLDVSAIESGSFDLKREKGNLGEVLKRRIELVNFSANAKGISITSDIADVPPVEFDHARINQVIDNLLTNAVKFSPPDSVIDTAIHQVGDNVSVVIRDHGQGIPAHEVDKVFLAFEKLSAKPTAGEKSTGLGLAIVKQIVDAHGGEIGVESTLGEGSTFNFSLPVEANL